MRYSALFLVMVMLFCLAVPAIAIVEAPCPREVIVPLRYGNNEIEVGSVTAWIDEGSLFVKYETTEDWYLTEIHLIAVTDLDDIPTANTPNNNNPIPGQFPISDEFDPTQEYTAEIPLDEEWEEGTVLFIMAHAALVRIEDEEVVQSEGAWGGEEEFDSTRFAFYFNLTICEGDDPSDENGDNGDGDNGDNGEYGDNDDNGNNGEKGESGENVGNGDDPGEEKGENGSQLPITGTYVSWLAFPGLAMIGTGLFALKRRR